MTTSTNPAHDALFLRQIPSEHFQDQTIWSSDFKGQNDPERLTDEGEIDTDYFAISVDIQVPCNDPQLSFERYTQGGGNSTGVAGLTFREITSLGLILEPAPEVGNPYHWHIVFPKGKNTGSRHKALRRFAAERGWLYAPEGVLPINPPDKPQN